MQQTAKSVTSDWFILTIRTFNIFRQATGQGVLAPEQTEWTLLFNGHQIPAFSRVADDKAVAATRVVRVSQPAIYSATSAQFCKTHIKSMKLGFYSIFIGLIKVQKIVKEVTSFIFTCIKKILFGRNLFLPALQSSFAF